MRSGTRVPEQPALTKGDEVAAMECELVTNFLTLVLIHTESHQQYVRRVYSIGFGSRLARSQLK